MEPGLSYLLKFFRDQDVKLEAMDKRSQHSLGNSFVLGTGHTYTVYPTTPKGSIHINYNAHGGFGCRAV